MRDCDPAGSCFEHTSISSILPHAEARACRPLEVVAAACMDCWGATQIWCTNKDDRHPRAISCKNCPIHCPGHFPFAARAKSRDKSRDKSPSVYSSDVDCLYDNDLADEPLISALQARVAGIETEQRAQRLAIEGAFLRDPHVDSD